MPPARPEPSVWRVLELAEASPASPATCGFYACWQAWRQDQLQRQGQSHAPLPRLPRFHYVLIATLPAGQAPETSAQPKAAPPPAFHRLSFDSGRVLFTLCVGDAKTLLREQAFVADEVLITLGEELGTSMRARTSREAGVSVNAMKAFDALPRHWDRWTAKALAQLCRHGTRLSLRSNAHSSSGPASPPSTETRSQAMAALLEQVGFQALTDQGLDNTERATRQNNGDSRLTLWRANFAPSWPSKSTRPLASGQVARPRAKAPAAGHCAIVGGGLAGASVAAAMAARGWRVTVLDAAATPASGASGVPVGLLCPHVSRDDSPRSRLSRAGVQLALQALRDMPPGRLRQGHDWCDTGAMERWLTEDAPPPSRAQDTLTLGDHPALWHAQAAWVKPEALIRAWLATPGVTWAGGQTVNRLQHDQGTQGTWRLLGASGACLAQADMVVLAAAGASPALANIAMQADAGRQQRALQAIAGQVSFGLQRPADGHLLPPYPLNGHGHLVAQVPQGGGFAWYTGSTYETEVEVEVELALPVTVRAAHAANAARLAQLLQGLPDTARALADRFDSGQVQHWRGTRFTPRDRLPVCGPLAVSASSGSPTGAAEPPPTLWASYGFGSRGLSWSVLCAELVAAQICGEPLPLPLGLARLLGSQRPAALAD